VDSRSFYASAEQDLQQGIKALFTQRQDLQQGIKALLTQRKESTY